MRSVSLVRPAPGQRVQTPLGDSNALVFSFNPAETVFRRRADSLLLFFADGASLELPGFFPGEGLPLIAVFLADGTRMDAAELLALFAPHLVLPPGSDLSALAGAGASFPQGMGLADFTGFAVEEDVLLSPEHAQTDDVARCNLIPVYQEIIFRDGEITIGPSIYGALFSVGGETGLHVQLGNSEAEMLDVDDFVFRLPGLFPEHPDLCCLAVTGGPENRVILDGRRLSPVLETVPLKGLGTTQFDHYEYRTTMQEPLVLYLETILLVAR